MFRKLLLAAGLASVMALGMGAASSPADAKVRVYIGTPGYYYGPGYYDGYPRYYHRYGHRCRTVVVKKWSRKYHRPIRVKRRVCR
jgi:hypothetical protein